MTCVSCNKKGFYYLTEKKVSLSEIIFEIEMGSKAQHSTAQECVKVDFTSQNCGAQHKEVMFRL